MVAPAIVAGRATPCTTMATPFDLRFLSSTDLRAAAPAAQASSLQAAPDPARLPAGRHPVGLMVVVGLHVLLAAVLLTARLDAGPPQVVQVALTKIEQVPPPIPKPQALPDAPRVALHPLVAPLPDIVVDTPSPVQAVAQAVPAAPAAATAPAPAKGEDGGALLPQVEPQPTRLNAGAAECRPVYPHIAEREGVTGITRLRFVVDAAGHVSAQLLQTSGPLRQNRRMDEAAIEALSHCPVTVGTDEHGRPVGGTVDVNYKWTIQ